MSCRIFRPCRPEDDADDLNCDADDGGLVAAHPCQRRRNPPTETNKDDAFRSNGWYRGKRLCITKGTCKRHKRCKFIDYIGKKSAVVLIMMEGKDLPTHCVVRCTSLRNRCRKIKRARQALATVNEAEYNLSGAQKGFSGPGPTSHSMLVHATKSRIDDALGSLEAAQGALERLVPDDELSFSSDDSLMHF